MFIDNLDLRLPRIALFSTRTIKAGEELTFDYQMKGLQALMLFLQEVWGSGGLCCSLTGDSILVHLPKTDSRTAIIRHCMRIVCIQPDMQTRLYPGALAFGSFSTASSQQGAVVRMSAKGNYRNAQSNGQATIKKLFPLFTLIFHLNY